MKNKHLWILTEERPKQEVIANILTMFAKDHKFACFIDTIRILPILENGKFSFLYEVAGFRSNKIGKVFIKSVSGFSSFVDFLIFYQEKQPTQRDIPLYAIEETKTDVTEENIINSSQYPWWRVIYWAGSGLGLLVLSYLVLKKRED